MGVSSIISGRNAPHSSVPMCSQSLHLAPLFSSKFYLRLSKIAFVLADHLMRTHTLSLCSVMHVCMSSVWPGCWFTSKVKNRRFGHALTSAPTTSGSFDPHKSCFTSLVALRLGFPPAFNNVLPSSFIRVCVQMCACVCVRMCARVCVRV